MLSGLKIILFLLSIMALLGSQSSSAAYYKFSLSGFDGPGLGGHITGTFKAKDVATHLPGGGEDPWWYNSEPNPDGKIIICP